MREAGTVVTDLDVAVIVVFRARVVIVVTLVFLFLVSVLWEVVVSSSVGSG